MPRKSIAPQSRRHVWLFDDDWAFIESRFGKQSPSNLGTSAAVRAVIQSWVANMRKKEQDRIEASKQITEETGK